MSAELEFRKSCREFFARCLHCQWKRIKFEACKYPEYTYLPQPNLAFEVAERCRRLGMIDIAEAYQSANRLGEGTVEWIIDGCLCYKPKDPSP